MFERFTDRARKILALANQSATLFNHSKIEPEHILLGIVREGSGVAVNILKKIVDINIIRNIRAKTEKLMEMGEEYWASKLPQSEKTKQIFVEAIEQARNLNDNYVGSEHLLLALCVIKSDITEKIFNQFGITFDKVLEENVIFKKIKDTPIEDFHSKELREVAKQVQTLTWRMNIVENQGSTNLTKSELEQLKEIWENRDNLIFSNRLIINNKEIFEKLMDKFLS